MKLEGASALFSLIEKEMKWILFESREVQK
jgi:hypothetical protein